MNVLRLYPTCVITTCKGRLDHLKETWEAKTSMVGSYRILVVDYDCPQECSKWVREHANERVHAVRVPNRPLYLGAHARNVGIRMALQLMPDVKSFAFIDADVTPRVDFIQATTDIIARHGHVYTELMGGRKHSAGGGGTHVASARVMTAINGYQEKLKPGWGWDDRDVFHRMALWYGAMHHRQRPWWGPRYPEHLVDILKHGDDRRLEHTTSDAEAIKAADKGIEPSGDRNSHLRVAENENKAIAEAWVAQHGYRANPEGFGLGKVDIITRH